MKDTFDRLDALLKNPPLTMPCPQKAVLFSDLHMGDGGPADDFWPNHELFCKTIIKYRDEGFRFFWLGDIFEGYQFSLEEIKERYKWLTDFIRDEDLIEGNHDTGLGHPTAILLTGAEKPILLTHGHIADDFIYNWPGIARFASRYLMKPLELMGFDENYFSASKNQRRHDTVRNIMIEWASSRDVTLVAGHIHTQEHEGNYWNGGSSVTPGKVECVEVVGGIPRLTTW